MRAKNLLNCMEYKAAKKILEEEAKPLLKELIEELQINSEDEDEEEKEADPTKDLPDGRYSF